MTYLEKLNPEQRRAVEHGLAGDARAPVGPLLVIAGVAQSLKLRRGFAENQQVRIAVNSRNCH
jgi:hypothetical protein